MCRRTRTLNLCMHAMNDVWYYSSYSNNNFKRETYSQIDYTYTFHIVQSFLFSVSISISLVLGVCQSTCSCNASDNVNVKIQPNNSFIHRIHFHFTEVSFHYFSSAHARVCVTIIPNVHIICAYACTRVQMNVCGCVRAQSNTICTTHVFKRWHPKYFPLKP